MKHTIAENKQLFNVKEIADAVTMEALADGQFGVFPADSDTSLPAAATYADLPEEFRIISKLNGQVYYSFDTIKKKELRNVNAKDYNAETVNVWEAVIKHCDCIKTATVKINLDEDTLMRERGLSWTTSDSLVENAPKELTCVCDCTGKPVYDNHIMTKAIWKKINSVDSPYYEAEVKVEGGAVLADEAAIDAFIAAGKAANTDDDEANDTANLVLVIKGKPSPARPYKDLDVNYIFPRGVRLTPAILLNDGASCVEFTETQELVYEIGAGADLRAEEFESMNYYTTLNHYEQLSDGIASEGLIYQFENGQNYGTLDFEFYTDKVNKNDGDKRSFGVMLASADTAVMTALKALFIE